MFSPNSKVFITNQGSGFYGLTGTVICTTRPVLGHNERMYEVEFDWPKYDIPKALFFANEIATNGREKVRL